MWDVSSPTRDQTHIPCIVRWIFNHWTTREVPTLYLYFEAWGLRAGEISRKRMKSSLPSEELSLPQAWKDTPVKRHTESETVTATRTLRRQPDTGFQWRQVQNKGPWFCRFSKPRETRQRWGTVFALPTADTLSPPAHPSELLGFSCSLASSSSPAQVLRRKF